MRVRKDDGGGEAGDVALRWKALYASAKARTPYHERCLSLSDQGRANFLLPRRMAATFLQRPDFWTSLPGTGLHEFDPCA